jgi:hypothetical protein
LSGIQLANHRRASPTARNVRSPTESSIRAAQDYLLGPRADPVAVEFALEAKCYGPGNGVGVRETSRLISRLRHRQFGVPVTTSHLDSQAYREIREDGHPVAVYAGCDLTPSGFSSWNRTRRPQMTVSDPLEWVYQFACEPCQVEPFAYQANGMMKG